MKSVSLFCTNVKNRVQKSLPPIFIYPHVVILTFLSFNGLTILIIKSGFILISPSPNRTIITFEELKGIVAEMQTRAIIGAAINVKKKEYSSYTRNIKMNNQSLLALDIHGRSDWQ